LETALAHFADNIFNAVRQLFNLKLAGRAGAPLEAVCLTEEIIQERLPLRMLRVALEFQEQFARRLTVLGLLFLESRKHLGHNFFVG
jgi:hypothetical protein